MTKEIHYEKMFNGYDGKYDHEIKDSYNIIPWGIKESWMKNVGIQQTLALSGMVNPPWLSLTREQLLAKSTVFPDGQIILEKEYGGHNASGDAGAMSMLPIVWDGNPESLPSLADILGPDGDGKQGFAPDANTLAITSLVVSPSAEEQDSVYPNHVTDHLVQYAVDYVKQHGMKHVIWSVPTGYDWSKQTDDIAKAYDIYVKAKKVIMPARGFTGYANSIIRMLHIEDLEPIKGDYAAVQKTVDSATFDWYKHVYPGGKSWPWKEITPSHWVYGGVGMWTVEGKNATYIEPHVWLGKSD